MARPVLFEARPRAGRIPRNATGPQARTMMLERESEMLQEEIAAKERFNREHNARYDKIWGDLRAGRITDEQSVSALDKLQEERFVFDAYNREAPARRDNALREMLMHRGEGVKIEALGRPNAKAKEAMAQVQRLIPDKGHTYKVQFKTIRRGSRAHHIWDNGVSYVSTASDDELRISMHELGHMIETDERILQKAVDHLYSRTSTEAPQSLAILENDPRYDPLELARPDAFYRPYVGKQYRVTSLKPTGRPTVADPYAGEGRVRSWIRSTEITSMGLDKLYENPTDLIREDPYLFDYLWEAVFN